MAYNRLDDEYYDNMDQRPSPANPFQTPGFDPPQHQQQNEAYPLDGMHGQHSQLSFGGSDYPMQTGVGHGRQQLGSTPVPPVRSTNSMNRQNSIESINHYNNEYGVNPEQHHDDYFSTPYDDSRPMLDHHGELGYRQQDLPYKDKPIGAGTPTPTPGLLRMKTVKKQFLLYRGNLVLDCPVPPKLLNQIPHGERDEFTHMRYTAATCDPNDFYAENFTLRQKLFSKQRHTELFIVITMYNEDDILFARSMIGVLKNIEFMCKRSESKTWGKDAWKKIVVCVVSDGRAKINPRTRALLAAMGIYQEGVAKQKVNQKEVTAHIYEYTTQVGLKLENDVVRIIPKAQPVQMLFCLKEKNQKKINSHRWFFNAFGQVLNPNICVLIDAGTKPGHNSIYHLWKAFELEPMCGGACGEIKAMLGRAGTNLFNPLVATQNFEYKMSNILDKPLESAFGFISVLPGAFSAYRYVALQNDKKGQGPLEKYFLGETLHGAGAGIFTSNMYLAEDRILCFELVTKRNCNWILQYVKSATGETDVPDTVTELVLQRRRWLNGSFFAAIYAIVHFYEFFRSDHSFLRKLAFFVEFVFNTINMIFAWFAIGNFFLVFKILTGSLGDADLLGNVGTILGVVFEWIYGVSLITCFVLSMGNRPAGSRVFYTAMVYFWAIIFVYLMFAAIFISVKAIQAETHEEQATGFSISQLFKNQVFYTLIVSVMSTYGIWIIASLLMFDPWHMFTSMVPYLLLSPTYINVLNVYAFCNTHDISWGTKGDDKAEKLPTVGAGAGGNVETTLPDEANLDEQYKRELAMISKKYQAVVKAPSPADLDEKQLDYYRGVRSMVVLVWMLTNFALAAVILSTAGFEKITPGNSASSTETSRATTYMSVILWSVAGLSAFKFLGAVWFLIVRMFRGV